MRVFDLILDAKENFYLKHFGFGIATCLKIFGRKKHKIDVARTRMHLCRFRPLSLGNNYRNQKEHMAFKRQNE